jgi:hypothetical protein
VTAVVSSGDATVIAAVLALIGGLSGLYVQQRRVHRDNRSDHQETAAKVDQLLVGQRDISADVRDVKADVRDHGERIRNLEGH